MASPDFFEGFRKFCYLGVALFPPEVFHEAIRLYPLVSPFFAAPFFASVFHSLTGSFLAVPSSSLLTFYLPGIHKKSVAIWGVVSPLSKILLRFGGLSKNLLRLEGLLRSRGWFLLRLGWLFSWSLAIDRALNPVAILGDNKIGRASALPAR